MRNSIKPQGNARDNTLSWCIAVGIVALTLLLLAAVSQLHSAPRSRPYQEKSASEIMDVDLRITLIVDTTEALPGDVLNYILTYQNFGTETARNVRITVNAPNPGSGGAGLYTTLLNMQPAGTATPPGANQLLQTIQWSSPDLPPAMAQAETITFSLRIIGTLDESKALTATAVIEATRFSPSEVSATTFVNLSSDIRIHKTVEEQPWYDVSDTVSYYITVTNDGNKREDLVTVRDIIPDGAVFIDSSFPVRLESNLVYAWDVGPIAANGGSLKIEVRLQYPSGGRYTNSCSGQVDEVLVTGNSVTIDVLGDGPGLTPHFRVEKRLVTPAPIIAGDRVEYEIRVTNFDNAAHTVTIFDNLPEGAEDPEPEPGWPDWDDAVSNPPSLLGWIAQNVPANGGSFEVHVSMIFPNPGTYTNVADGTFGVSPLNSASVTITVLPKSNLTTNFVDCQTNTDPGSPVQLSANVMNSGGSTASPVEVAFYVDAIAAGNIIESRALGSLESGNSEEVSIVWTNPAGGSRRYYVLVDPENLVDEAGFESDNVDSTLCPPPSPPLISVTPAQVCPGPDNPVTLRLEAFAALREAFVRVLYPNGSQGNRNYALPGPGAPVNAEFQTGGIDLFQEEELVVFEYHTVDVFDNIGFASDTLHLRCNDDFRLGENTYQPSLQLQGLPIEFKLSTRRRALLKIYDLAGREIASVFNAEAQSGWNTRYWSGRDKEGRTVGAGIYLVTIESGDLTGWRKFILVR